MKRNGNRVGVRELRQNLSFYVRRVASGEVLEVTKRGRPVAILAPKLQSSPRIERLVAAGRAIPPMGDLIALGPPVGSASSRLSKALEKLRAERL
jgi:prevent-host-death family protein